MAALGGSIARRYARALFAMGVDKANLDQLGRELDDLAALYASAPDLRQTLENPVFKGSEKRAILDKLLPRVAPTRVVHNFALLLLERGRIAALPMIARAFRELADAHAGRVRAEVKSAQPLDPTTLASLQHALERRTGKKVVIEASVDPSLIGGLYARVGDLVLDGTVRNKLDSMREKLIN